VISNLKVKSKKRLLKQTVRGRQLEVPLLRGFLAARRRIFLAIPRPLHWQIKYNVQQKAFYEAIPFFAGLH